MQSNFIGPQWYYPQIWFTLYTEQVLKREIGRISLERKDVGEMYEKKDS